MDIGQSQSDYKGLGAALRAAIKAFDLLDPKASVKNIRQQMGAIFELAERIGSPLKKGADELKRRFEQLKAKPGDAHFAAMFLEQALRLEQETREI